MKNRQFKVDLSDEDQPEDYVMPFGMFEGYRLGEIPNGYLRWAAEEWDANDFAELRNKIEAALDNRDIIGEYIPYDDEIASFY